MNIKVVHISTSDGGGAGVSAVRLHEGLLQLGIQSKMICSDRRSWPIADYLNPYPYSRKIRLFRKLSILKNPVVEYSREIRKAGGEYECFSSPITDYRVENHLAVKEADIIHLHSISNFVNFPTFFAKIKKPIVWTLHDMNPFMGGFHYKGDLIRNKDNASLCNIEKAFIAIKQKAIQFSNINICTPSSWLNSESSNSSLLGKQQHYYIPYGLNIETFRSHNKMFCREFFNLPTDKKIILFLCENINNKRKGFDLFLEAVKRISNLENLVLVAVGNARNDYEIPNLIHMGSINDPKLLSMVYCAADVLVLPSREDNLPNVMLESLACGTPVISFKVGGISETIINYFNGILCEQITANSLANSINQFLTLENFKSCFIREHFINKFALEVQAKSYVKIYNDLYKNSSNYCP